MNRVLCQSTILFLVLFGMSSVHAQPGEESSLSAEVVASVKSSVKAVETQLREKWEMSTPHVADEPFAIRGQMVAEKQMLYCKAFSAEQSLKKSLETTIHIYPAIIYDDNTKSIRIQIEALTCAPLRPEMITSICDTV